MKHKKTFMRLMIVLFCSCLLFLCSYCNWDSYDTTIAKVISVQETVIDSDTVLQDLTGTIKNGTRKGQEVRLENRYDKSLVYDDQYSEGNFLFISVDDSSAAPLTGSITGVKRDYYVVLTLLILLDLLILIGGKQGSFTILGLFINVGLFSAMLMLYGSGANILLLSIGLVILFSAVVLFLINGRNRRTLISLCATLGAVAFIGLLSALIIWLGPEISYEFMEYLPEPYTRGEANLLFLSEILIGGLGVIMDIAVTITACAAELIRKDPRISRRSLLLSCRQVADDITGTMINVVFFTNIAACIPVFIISMKNDISFFTVMKYNAFFEIARFLTGSMGIIITIPLAMFAASCFLKGGKNTCS